LIYQGEIKYKKIVHINNFLNCVQNYTAISFTVIAFGITHLEAEHNILDMSSDISLDAVYLVNRYD